jgi:hypothetical protein
VNAYPRHEERRDADQDDAGGNAEREEVDLSDGGARRIAENLGSVLVHRHRGLVEPERERHQCDEEEGRGEDSGDGERCLPRPTKAVVESH